ncbi:DUF3108 domain-containing protein [Tolypothrix campylonemoides VB511288]|nr:DUF3108 domain-containing protein [Tolypothrix campylonemoides VB511288]
MPTARLATRALAAATLLLASLPALAVKPFTADYEASYMGMQAAGRMQLAPAGEDRWRYSLDISNQIANLRQSTVFEDRGGQWRPLSGSDANTVLVKKSEKNATYDWQRGVATWTGDVKPERAGPVKLRAGDLDALMIHLALPRDVAAGKPLRYRMVEDGRVKELAYTVAGQDTVTVDGKAMRATKVVNVDGNRETTAWIVAGMPVPARITQKRKGEVLDLQVKAVR